MLKNRSELRFGATAIAVVVAALSTPAVAQDAVSDAPAPAVEVPAPVILDAPPPETDATESTQDATEAASVSAQAPTSVRNAPSAASRRAATASAPVARTVPPSTSEPAATAAAADPAPIAPAPLAVQPSAPVPAPVATSDDSRLAEIAFGGALALLALGGTVAVLRRRSEADEDLVYEEDAYEPPAVSPAVATFAPVRAAAVEPTSTYRSAFSWGASAPMPAQRSESWEDRARRGPTPNNPSLSLKKRLKRAAFFDNRAREVAAGVARPIAAAAGLPERAASAVRSATRQGVTRTRVLQPA